MRRRWHADLGWTGATSSSVDVYRDGARIATTPNDGAFRDATTLVGGGSVTYGICEAGTTTCSNQATVTFVAGRRPLLPAGPGRAARGGRTVP